MNPRSFLTPGPSRLRPLLAPLLPSTLPSTRRYLLTFPHPDLDPSKGSTRLVIRTFNNIPSLLHAYAIIRAVEAKLGASVLDMHLPKDPDSLNPGPTIYLTTLRPVKLDSPLLLEIPSPAISSESNFLGGPSLHDVQAILNNEGAVPSASTELTRSPSGKKDELPLQFRVEVAKNQSQSRRGRERAGSASKHALKNKRKRHRADGKEAAEIVRELKNFGGGFYGGFEGLAEKFEGLLINPSERGLSQQLESTEGDQPIGKATSQPPVKETEEAAVDVREVKEESKSLLLKDGSRGPRAANALPEQAELPASPIVESESPTRPSSPSSPASSS
ncbi:hypothetical protein IAR55_003103 [Kwoniella newhampshirensis]|uniref:Sld7 C-terminal domain-containing protein n=1 Tax=Kwoniella newhampshirensis TaxID=1651941 RepID=A0AAW0Z0H9_9TREE